MTFEELTKITSERINNFMAEAVKTDSEGIAAMFHNAAWGVRTLWFELSLNMVLDLDKKDKWSGYALKEKIDKQHEEFRHLTDRERVPLLKSPE